jgi:hypothetical protein
MLAVQWYWNVLSVAVQTPQNWTIYATLRIRFGEGFHLRDDAQQAIYESDPATADDIVPDQYRQSITPSMIENIRRELYRATTQRTWPILWGAHVPTSYQVDITRDQFAIEIQRNSQPVLQPRQVPPPQTVPVSAQQPPAEQRTIRESTFASQPPNAFVRRTFVPQRLSDVTRQVTDFTPDDMQSMGLLNPPSQVAAQSNISVQQPQFHPFEYPQPSVTVIQPDLTRVAGNVAGVGVTYSGFANQNQQYYIPTSQQPKDADTPPNGVPSSAGRGATGSTPSNQSTSARHSGSPGNFNSSGNPTSGVPVGGGGSQPPPPNQQNPFGSQQPPAGFVPMQAYPGPSAIYIQMPQTAPVQVHTDTFSMSMPFLGQRKPSMQDAGDYMVNFQDCAAANGYTTFDVLKKHFGRGMEPKRGESYMSPQREWFIQNNARWSNADQMYAEFSARFISNTSFPTAQDIWDTVALRPNETITSYMGRIRQVSQRPTGQNQLSWSEIMNKILRVADQTNPELFSVLNFSRPQTWDDLERILQSYDRAARPVNAAQQGLLQSQPARQQQQSVQPVFPAQNQQTVQQQPAASSVPVVIPDHCVIHPGGQPPHTNARCKTQHPELRTSTRPRVPRTNIPQPNLVAVCDQIFTPEQLQAAYAAQAQAVAPQQRVPQQAPVQAPQQQQQPPQTQSSRNNNGEGGGARRGRDGNVDLRRDCDKCRRTHVGQCLFCTICQRSGHECQNCFLNPNSAYYKTERGTHLRNQWYHTLDSQNQAQQRMQALNDQRDAGGQGGASHAEQQPQIPPQNFAQQHAPQQYAATAQPVPVQPQVFAQQQAYAQQQQFAQNVPQQYVQQQPSHASTSSAAYSQPQQYVQQQQQPFIPSSESATYNNSFPAMAPPQPQRQSRRNNVSSDVHRQEND